MIPMIGTIIPNEYALKKNFDELGRRRLIGSCEED
jgi:hypothetical protein